MLLAELVNDRMSKTLNRTQKGSVASDKKQERRKQLSKDYINYR